MQKSTAWKLHDGPLNELLMEILKLDRKRSVFAEGPAGWPDVRGTIHCVLELLHSILMLAELMIGVHLATSLVPSRSADVSRALNTHDTQLSLVRLWMLARRGHQRCHCYEEGFGTLSRQLENDEGYCSSCAGESGCFPRWPAMP
jgi:hypothetical protein